MYLKSSYFNKKDIVFFCFESTAIYYKAKCDVTGIVIIVHQHERSVKNNCTRTIVIIALKKYTSTSNENGVFKEKTISSYRTARVCIGTLHLHVKS